MSTGHNANSPFLLAVKLTNGKTNSAYHTVHITNPVDLSGKITFVGSYEWSVELEGKTVYENPNHWGTRALNYSTVVTANICRFSDSLQRQYSISFCRQKASSQFFK